MWTLGKRRPFCIALCNACTSGAPSFPSFPSFPSRPSRPGPIDQSGVVADGTVGAVTDAAVEAAEFGVTIPSLSAILPSIILPVELCANFSKVPNAANAIVEFIYLLTIKNNNNNIYIHKK